jgi:hypothetical protein
VAFAAAVEIVFHPGIDAGIRLLALEIRPEKVVLISEGALFE